MSKIKEDVTKINYRVVHIPSGKQWESTAEEYTSEQKYGLIHVLENATRKGTTPALLIHTEYGRVYVPKKIMNKSVVHMYEYDVYE